MTVKAQRELRDSVQVASWLSTGLCLMRMNRPSHESLARAIPWLRASISDAPALPPAGVIADVGVLLEGGKLDLESGMPVGEPRLRAAVRAYEDGLLGRLAADARFEAASDALARLPDERRSEGVAVLVAQLLSHILYPEATAVSPAVARRVLGRPTAELLQLGLAGLRGGAGAEDLQADLAPGYEQLVHRARHTDVLLTDKDVFTLENLTVLRSLAQRLAIQQMVDAAQVLERALPRRLRRRPGRRGGTTPTKIEDESAYPTGGFAAITNSGSLENIVCSELVYMDEGEEFDLFDVRFAEAELLFYSRDESVFMRNQRSITFLLHPDMVRARFKDAELPWQRLVLVFGLMLCAVRRLHDWLSEEALLFRFILLQPEGGGSTPLTEEAQLLRLLLREWIDKGTVQISEGGLEAAVTGGEAAVVLVASDEGAARMFDSPPFGRVPGRRGVGPSTTMFGLGQSRPTVRATGRRLERDRPAQSAMDAWTEATRMLLEELL